MLKAGTVARRRTLTWETAQSPDAIREQITALLNAIDGQIQTTQPEWIGHIKIMLINGAETMYGSLTTAADQVRWAGTLLTPITRGELTIYAAIYSVSDALVAQSVDTALLTLPDHVPVIPLGDAAAHEH